MADGLNRVFLLGNLGADPELRFTQQGKAVLNIRLATSESWLDGDERKTRTEWHAVTVWGARAEGLAKILHKGDRIHVEGSIRSSSYEKDGQKHYKTEIVASDVLLAGSPRGNDAPAPEARETARTSSPKPAGTAPSQRQAPARTTASRGGQQSTGTDDPF